MIDATRDSRHGYSLNELQWRKFAWRRRRCGWRGTAQAKENCGRNHEEPQTSVEILHIFPPLKYGFPGLDFRVFRLHFVNHDIAVFDFSRIPGLPHGCGSKTKIAASSWS